MRTESPVIGIFCSDIHWSEKAPLARSVESDWWATQGEYIFQLRKLQDSLSGVPIYIAGDLFSNWNYSVAFANFLIESIQGMRIYAIPGNHDLPNHSLEQISRSILWTISKPDFCIKVITDRFCVEQIGVRVSFFPYGQEVVPLQHKKHDLVIDVALIHSYIWTKTTGHKFADEKSRYKAWEERLSGYDWAVFGDNHKSFTLSPEGKCKIFNCGAFQRCLADEVDHEPSVGLLHSNGEMTRHYLDTSSDKFLTKEQTEAVGKKFSVNLSSFHEELLKVGQSRENFVDKYMAWIKSNDVGPEVKEIMERIIRSASGNR